ncbi:MAG: hypothetical protein AB4372_23540, partial [Xenococcus sp. (in: cyanobacteria)]
TRIVKKGKNSTSNDEDWGIRISRLIAAGHQWQDIQDYSLGQIKIFLKAANQLEGQRRAAMISDLRLAAWGEGKQIQRVLDSLYS